jgi:hypothetical protein
MPSKSNKGKLQPFRYPAGILEDHSDYLYIGIRSYKPSKNSTSEAFRLQSLAQGTSLQQSKSVANIILPIPTSITASNGVTWNGGSMNVLEKLGVEAGMMAMDGKVQEAFQKLIDEANKIGTGDSTIKGAQSFFASKAIQALGSQVSFSQVLSRTTGQVLNPNLELLFSGPGLRSFSFNYQLSPRDENEAQTVKNILRVLKQSMSPRRGTSTAFLCAPHLFHLSFKKGNGDHPYLNRFKTMALVNIGVNYTGTGTYATYEDGSPVVYNLSMEFQELSPVYNEDYAGEQGLIGAGY